MIQAELVYISTDNQAIHLHLMFESGATVADVIAQSGLAQSHPEIVGMAVGIYAKVVSLDTVVRAGDRIEIYRPLLIDPKENRRQRARQKG